MTSSLVHRLLVESGHLRDVEDPQLDALRRAVLVEDVLGVRLSDEQISVNALTDARTLQALAVDARRGD